MSDHDNCATCAEKRIFLLICRVFGGATMIYSAFAPAQAPIPDPCTATLSSAAIAHFWREGYCLARGLVDSAACEAVAEAVAARKDDRVTAAGTWTPTIFDPLQPQEDADLHRLLVHPHVVAAVHDIFGLPPRFLYGMVAVVPAGGGRGLAWHQDNMYSQVLGGALNVFIALRDIAPEQCMLWLAPRSHVHGVLPSNFTEGHHAAQYEPENGFRLPALRQGDVAIFDRNTLHRSLRNETETVRYAYAAQFCSPLARLAESGAIPEWPLISTLANLMRTNPSRPMPHVV